MATPSNHTNTNPYSKAAGTNVNELVDDVAELTLDPSGPSINELVAGVEELALDRSVFDPVHTQGGVPRIEKPFSFGGSDSYHKFNVNPTAPPISASTRQKLQVSDDVDEECEEWIRKTLQEALSSDR
jgi:hypothetical protein